MVCFLSLLQFDLWHVKTRSGLFALVARGLNNCRLSTSRPAMSNVRNWPGVRVHPAAGKLPLKTPTSAPRSVHGAGALGHKETPTSRPFMTADTTEPAPAPTSVRSL